MKSFILLPVKASPSYCLLCLLVHLSTAAHSQDLDFNATQPIYPNGALSHAYTAIGTPAVDVSVSVGGSGQLSLNSPQPTPNGLTISSVDFANHAERRTFTFTFAVPVVGLYFNINALNQNLTANDPTDRYQDQVTFHATDYAGQPAPANITPGAGYTISGNTVTAVSETHAAFTVTYSYGIKTLTIEFGSGPLAPANPGKQGFTIGDMYWSALPVTVADLSGKRSAAGVELSWTAFNSQSVSQYAIERSTDLQTFEAVGSLKPEPSGSGQTRLTYTDPLPPAQTVYYRLAQRYLAGGMSLSRSVAVAESSDEPIVFPNPTDGRLIRVKNALSNPASFQLTDMTGRWISVSVTVSMSEISIQPHWPLPPGIYVLSWVQDGGKRLSRRVLVEQ